jgi:hypothetical protein
MWVSQFIEAYDKIYSTLREIGYDAHSSGEAATLFTVLGICCAIYFAVEIITHAPS